MVELFGPEDVIRKNDAKKDKIKIRKGIQNIGVNIISVMIYTQNDISSIPNNCGAYIIRTKTKKCYVGSAKRLRDRLSQHKKGGYNTNIVEPIESIKICLTENLIDARILEYFLIRELRPDLNFEFCRDYSYEICKTLEYGIVIIRVVDLDPIKEIWSFYLHIKDSDQKFDNVMVVCMDRDRRYIEKVYLIPYSKVCLDGDILRISISRDPFGSRWKKFEVDKSVFWNTVDI